MQNPAVLLNGVVSGDTVIPVLSAGKVDVGVYEATVSVDDPNYILLESTSTKRFEITKAPVSVVWSATTTYTYDGGAKTPTASASELSLTYSYEKLNTTTNLYEAISGPPSEVGQYRVTATTSSENHTLSNGSLTYFIVAPASAG